MTARLSNLPFSNLLASFKLNIALVVKKVTVALSPTPRGMSALISAVPALCHSTAEATWPILLFVAA